MEAFISGLWRGNIRRGNILTGGQERRFTRAEGYINGAWKPVALFTAPLSATANPSVASGSVFPNKPTVQTVTTDFVTITPTGGLGPYTYIWNGGIYPTSASNRFSASVPGNSTIEQTYTYTVTDSLGKSVSGTVQAVFTNGQL